MSVESWGSGPRPGEPSASPVLGAKTPGAVLSSLASLGETLKIGHLCEGLQRFQMFQQQTGEPSLKEQQQLLDMAEQHAASLTGQELASSASVMRLTKMRWRGPLVPLIAAVVRNATQRLMKPSSNVSMQLNAQNILDIFHSAAVHAFHPGDGLFLQTVLKMMEIRLQGFSAQDQTRAAWALAQLGCLAAAPLMETIILHLDVNEVKSSPGGMVDVIWAAAVLDVRAPAALSRLRELAALLELPQLDVSSQQRLFQAHMAFERGSENGSGGQGVPLLPSEMLPLTKAAWQDKLKSIPVSQAQEEVSAALHAMGVDHKVAPTSDGGVLKPDLAIISPSGRIALSVNSASDFCANSPYQPQGDAILGWRLLMLYDWKVVSIPFFKWQTLTTSQARTQFLQELLPVSSVQTQPEPSVSQGALWQGGPQGEGLQAAEEGVPAIRARSLSEDTVRIHPSPAPSASWPLQLSRLASQDSALLRDSDTAVLMSRLMASQQSMRAADSTAQRSGSALAVPPVREARGITANLSDPGALATFLEASDSGMSTSKTTGGQPGHSRSTTSAMTISDQSTTTGFGDSMPVLHQREISEASAMSGLASMDMPGPAGSATVPLSSQNLEGVLPRASLESAGLSAVIGKSESSQSLADSISTTSGPALSVSEATASATLAAMAASMAQSGQGTLWATDELAARLAALSTAQQPGISMQGAALEQQLQEGAGPSYVSQAAMYGRAPSLDSGSTISQLSSVASLQQMLASGQVDERLLSTLQGLTARQPAPPTGMPRGFGAGMQGMGLGQASAAQSQAGSQLPTQQQPAYSSFMGSGSEGSGGSASVGSQSRRDMTSEQAATAHQLWRALAQAEGQAVPQDAANAVELKRIIEGLPLETSAVAAVEWRLGQLEPSQFAALLTELARDNHAFRAWQLFDWVRTLPEGHSLQRLCDANTYSTMITLCGPWQQLRRALQLVAEMRSRSLECGIQAYSALLHAAVKCGETDLAVDVYGQMKGEGMPRERTIHVTMIEMFVKLGRVSDALAALGELHASGEPPDTHLYNLVLVAATKLGQPRFALTVYHRMVADGAVPNTKTFTALIGSFGKMGSVGADLDIVTELLGHDQGAAASAATYAALMAACEKAGQGDLALALFEKMKAEKMQPDAAIFNSMIAACAHGGEFAKARLMFDSMAEHNCQPDAVTFANLIRAYKKGGQWCAALDTFEAMLQSGCRPHAAVYSSIIDVLWQTGITWAQVKALALFNSAVGNGALPAAAESCKKGTLKLDLLSLTVGVAVVSMSHWLLQARSALLHDNASPLDAARKLAVVNGLGEHSRAQGHSAAVKEAVGASLLGCKAPFRLVQDHSRSGRLEASTLALRKWLFSEHFDRYLSLLHAEPAESSPELSMSTSAYLAHETAEKERAMELWQRVIKHESTHLISLKILHSNPGGYLQQRKQLVTMILHYASALRVAQEVAHSAVSLMDRVMMSGVHMTDQFQTLFICACLRLAALQESAQLPTGLAISALTEFPDMALERMESNIMAVLRHDMECIAAIHCLKVYCQRLGCDLSDGAAVRRAAGCAFALATEALSDMAILQFPPSLTAAAILVAARRAQGSVPFWPSVLSQLTGYTEASSPPFASAIAHAGRLCSKLYTSAEVMAPPPPPIL
ncbi:hypothetical protein CVIRNUC_007414 [Coccomyxa viridis]|uniref:RAP domain-containing protein n=1 Tax=Coccomyxa viridis TaxID=1274662 RepID=A0AAV1ICI5_9CHLO|nr:hypothetical protein CVIRNUC_007414 [Coccomyxa viridis]